MREQDKTVDVKAAHPYRFENFNISVMMRDMRFSRSALKPGDHLPDAAMLDSQGASTTLYALCADKPLLLITGSITCPMTISALPLLEPLQVRFGDVVNFALLYVREAHPAEHYPQPQTLEQKIENANKTRQHYGVTWPVLIDDLEGSLHQALDTKPNSAHLIGADGAILFQSLWAGDNAALEQAVRQTVQGDPISKPISQKMMAPFLRGAGFMHEALNHAGKRAYRELAWGAPPIALLSKTASLFGFLSKNSRGLAAMVLLIVILMGVGFLF
ncbi:TlpA family protein disulfide reductase [Pseudomonadota bacterium]